MTGWPLLFEAQALSVNSILVKLLFIFGILGYYRLLSGSLAVALPYDTNSSD